MAEKDVNWNVPGSKVNTPAVVHRDLLNQLSCR